MKINGFQRRLGAVFAGGVVVTALVSSALSFAALTELTHAPPVIAGVAGLDDAFVTTRDVSASSAAGEPSNGVNPAPSASSRVELPGVTTLLPQSRSERVRQQRLRTATAPTRPKSPKTHATKEKPRVDMAPAWEPVVLRPTLDAPRCEDAYVYIASVFERPGESVATLAIGDQATGSLVRVGSRLDGYRVIAIAYNWMRLSPAVWLAKKTEVCQALLATDNPLRKRKRGRAKTSRGKRSKRRKR